MRAFSLQISNAEARVIFIRTVLYYDSTLSSILVFRNSYSRSDYAHLFPST